MTLNSFLLDVNLRSRETSASRLPLIAPEVARLDPDIILLQEVWGGYYRRYLQRAFADRGWRFSTYDCRMPTACASSKLTAGLAATAGLTAVGASRAARWSRRAFICAGAGSLLLAGSSAVAANTLRDYGNGLLIISRWPIADTTAMSFRTHTRMDEALVYKGAVRARIQVPGSGPLDVVNTHLGARTYDFERGGYDSQTVSANDRQLDELAEWLKAGAGNSTGPEQTSPLMARAMVVAGDFNFNPWVVRRGKITDQTSPSYAKLVREAPQGLGLSDSFTAANGAGVDGYTGGTATAFGAGQRDRKPPERIDYIFTSKAVSVKSSRVVLNDVIRHRCDSERLMMDHKLHELPLHVSDHFGLLSELALPNTTGQPNDNPDTRTHGPMAGYGL